MLLSPDSRPVTELVNHCLSVVSCSNETISETIIEPERKNYSENLRAVVRPVISVMKVLLVCSILLDPEIQVLEPVSSQVAHHGFHMDRYDCLRHYKKSVNFLDVFSSKKVSRPRKTSRFFFSIFVLQRLKKYPVYTGFSGFLNRRWNRTTIPQFSTCQKEKNHWLHRSYLFRWQDRSVNSIFYISARR